MTTDQREAKRTHVRRARLFTADLFEPTRIHADGEELYRVQAIIEASDPAFQRLAAPSIVMTTHLLQTDIEPRGISNPYLAVIPGNDVRGSDGNPLRVTAGNIVVRATSKRRPPVYSAIGEELSIEQSGLIYPGCYVHLILEYYPITSGHMPPGIYADILGVKFVEDGRPFSRTPKRKMIEVSKATFDEPDDEFIERMHLAESLTGFGIS